eukprot:gene19922-biopygen5540
MSLNVARRVARPLAVTHGPLPLLGTLCTPPQGIPPRLHQARRCRVPTPRPVDADAAG